MSARDDWPFPYLPQMSSAIDRNAVEQHGQMCDLIDSRAAEITQLTRAIGAMSTDRDFFRSEADRLTRWKAEAAAVLVKWYEVADLFPDMPLGTVLSDGVKAGVARLTEALRTLRGMATNQLGYEDRERMIDIINAALEATSWPVQDTER